MSDLLKQMNKRFGEDAFYTFADPTKNLVHPIPFSVPSLDYASGINGAPSGRIIELYGEPSSGKTTLTLMLIKSVQSLQKNKDSFFFGKRAAFIDAECAASREHMKAMGVDFDEKDGLLLTEPDSGEQAFDMAEALCESGEVSLIIIDSVAALAPKAEVDKDNDYNPVGLQARMMSKGLRKLKSVAKRTGTLIVFINQTRVNAGQMFGNPETTAGGKALEFYCSMRIRLSRKLITDKKDKIGQTITCEFIKNKVAAPYGKTEFDYFYTTGVDIYKDIAEMADRLNIFNKNGSWYYLGDSFKEPKELSDGTKIKFNGKEQLSAAFRFQPELFMMVNSQVQEALKPKEHEAPEDVEDEFVTPPEETLV
ncbi:AAA family ATPase [Rhodococcus sp. IEGM1300]